MRYHMVFLECWESFHFISVSFEPIRIICRYVFSVFWGKFCSDGQCTMFWLLRRMTLTTSWRMQMRKNVPFKVICPSEVCRCFLNKIKSAFLTFRLFSKWRISLCNWLLDFAELFSRQFMFSSQFARLLLFFF